MSIDLRTPDASVSTNWRLAGKTLLATTATVDGRDLEVFLKVAEQLYLRLESPAPSFYQSRDQPETEETLPTQREICELVQTVLEHSIRTSKDPQEIRRLVALSDYWDLRQQLRLRPAAEDSLKEAAARAVERALENERERLSSEFTSQIEGQVNKVQGKLTKIIILAAAVMIGTVISLVAATTIAQRASHEALSKTIDKYEVRLEISGQQTNERAHQLEAQTERIRTDLLAARAELDELIDAGTEKTLVGLRARLDKLEGSRFSADDLLKDTARTNVEAIIRTTDAGFAPTAFVVVEIDRLQKQTSASVDNLRAEQIACRHDGGCPALDVVIDVATERAAQAIEGCHRDGRCVDGPTMERAVAGSVQSGLLAIQQRCAVDGGVISCGP